jgi:hypothetical protein
MFQSDLDFGILKAWLSIKVKISNVTPLWNYKKQKSSKNPSSLIQE